MKSAPLRQILADLRMPGALEALDTILHGVDGGTLTAPEAIEQLLAAQIQLRNNRAGCMHRPSAAPAALHDRTITGHVRVRRSRRGARDAECVGDGR
jgi:hypothetical protein